MLLSYKPVLQFLSPLLEGLQAGGGELGAQQNARPGPGVGS